MEKHEKNLRSSLYEGLVLVASGAIMLLIAVRYVGYFTEVGLGAIHAIQDVYIGMQIIP